MTSDNHLSHLGTFTLIYYGQNYCVGQYAQPQNAWFNAAKDKLCRYIPQFLPTPKYRLVGFTPFSSIQRGTTHTSQIQWGNDTVGLGAYVGQTHTTSNLDQPDGSMHKVLELILCMFHTEKTHALEG